MEAVDDKSFEDDDEWHGFLVTVIPRSPHSYSHPIHEDASVTETDGVSFYELVTGDRDALYELTDHMIEYFGLESEMAGYVLHLVQKSLPPR